MAVNDFSSFTVLIHGLYYSTSQEIFFYFLAGLAYNNKQLKYFSSNIWLTCIYLFIGFLKKCFVVAFWPILGIFLLLFVLSLFIYFSKFQANSYTNSSLFLMM